MRHDLKQLLRAAEARGWRVELTRRGGHVRLVHPDGGLVVAASTPSDHRALANLRAQPRRVERLAAGLVRKLGPGRGRYLASLIDEAAEAAEDDA